MAAPAFQQAMPAQTVTMAPTVQPFAPVVQETVLAAPTVQQVIQPFGSIMQDTVVAAAPRAVEVIQPMAAAPRAVEVVQPMAREYVQPVPRTEVRTETVIREVDVPQVVEKIVEVPQVSVQENLVEIPIR